MADMTNATIPRVDESSQGSSGGASESVKDSAKDTVSDKAKDKAKTKSAKRIDDDGSKSDDKKSDKKSNGKSDNHGLVPNDNKDDKKSDKEQDSEDTSEDKQSDDEEDDKKKDKNSAKEKAKKGIATNVASEVGKQVISHSITYVLKMWLAALLDAIRNMIANIINGFLQWLGHIANVVGNVLVGFATAVGTALGVSAATALFGVGGAILIGAVCLVGVAVSVISSNDTAARDSMAVVDEPQQCIVESYEEYVGDDPAVETDLEKTQLEHAQKIYSFLMGGNIVQGDSKDDKILKIAGVLGNWTVESGIDPTGVEGVYGDAEKYTIGASKSKAVTDMNDYCVNTLFPMYAESGVKINKSGYSHDGKYYCGIGLGQFTGPAAYRLTSLANNLGKNWYDLDVQLAYTIKPGEEGYRSDFFSKWTEPIGSAENAARYFLEHWEGCTWSEALKSSARTAAAENWEAQIKSWSADSTYANSIIEMAGTTASVASEEGYEEAVDECGGSSSRSVSTDGIYADVINDVTVDSAFGPSDSRVNDIDFAEFIAEKLDTYVENGNIKPEYNTGMKDTLWGGKYYERDGGEYWKGQCVAWSVARIKSYFRAKYNVNLIVGKFGNGGDPYSYYTQGCLGANVLVYPVSNCVFSYKPEGEQFGHTGYVEYVCENGDLITSECNIDYNGHFGIRYVPYDVYTSQGWAFFSVDDMYENNKDKITDDGNLTLSNPY